MCTWFLPACARVAAQGACSRCSKNALRNCAAWNIDLSWCRCAKICAAAGDGATTRRICRARPPASSRDANISAPPFLSCSDEAEVVVAVSLGVAWRGRGASAAARRRGVAQGASRVIEWLWAPAVSSGHLWRARLCRPSHHRILRRRHRCWLPRRCFPRRRLSRRRRPRWRHQLGRRLRRLCARAARAAAHTRPPSSPPTPPLMCTCTTLVASSPPLPPRLAPSPPLRSRALPLRRRLRRSPSPPAPPPPPPPRRQSDLAPRALISCRCLATPAERLPSVLRSAARWRSLRPAALARAPSLLRPPRRAARARPAAACPGEG